MPYLLAGCSFAQASPNRLQQQDQREPEDIAAQRLACGQECGPTEADSQSGSSVCEGRYAASKRTVVTLLIFFATK